MDFRICGNPSLFRMPLQSEWVNNERHDLPLLATRISKSIYIFSGIFFQDMPSKLQFPERHKQHFSRRFEKKRGLGARRVPLFWVFFHRWQKKKKKGFDFPGKEEETLIENPDSLSDPDVSLGCTLRSHNSVIPFYRNSPSLENGRKGSLGRFIAQ